MPASMSTSRIARSAGTVRLRFEVASRSACNVSAGQRAQRSSTAASSASGLRPQPRRHGNGVGVGGEPGGHLVPAAQVCRAGRGEPAVHLVQGPARPYRRQRLGEAVPARRLVVHVPRWPPRVVGTGRRGRRGRRCGRRGPGSRGWSAPPPRKNLRTDYASPCGLNETNLSGLLVRGFGLRGCSGSRWTKLALVGPDRLDGTTRQCRRLRGPGSVDGTTAWHA